MALLPHLLEFLKSFKRTFLAAMLFISILTAFTISRYIPSLSASVGEFLLALTAATAVHLLDRLWLFHDFKEWSKELESKVVHNLTVQTGDLVKSVQVMISSLQSMESAGVVRLCATRDEASEDMHRDITDPNNRTIKLIGISLNDFILGKDPYLGKAWTKISKMIEGGNVSVRILLIDPECFGAQLRSKGEERLDTYTYGRLKHDVDLAIAEIEKLQNAFGKVNTTIECKLYRLAPVLFLCQLDSVSYVQPYYFWSSRSSIPLPMLRISGSRPNNPYSLHAELEGHFEWIWQKASIDISDFQQEWSRGADRGLFATGIANIFTDPNTGFKRMKRLLSTAIDEPQNGLSESGERRVSIQGVSLHSFFSREGQTLREEIYSLIEGDKIDIDILFLDPSCEQAKIRGYREYTLGHANVAREEYFNPNTNIHQHSTLYRDTSRAIEEFKSMVRSIASGKAPDWQVKVRAGTYTSAPYCFLLRINGRVLVEQYHYGKLNVGNPHAGIILGKEFPLVEYISVPETLYSPLDKVPFKLLENHFDFSFRLSDRLSVQEWADSEPRR